MKDVSNTETNTANEQLVTPQSVEPARESVPTVMPRVVIVGAGFAGLHAARALRDAPVQVTVIDRNNHHLFQPLLYQVATGSISPADICAPIRSVLSKQKNAEVLMGEVTGVDTQAQRVLLGDQPIPYDYLILATGARDSYFGHNDWAQFAPGLKSVVQATSIRRQILLAFEIAERETDPQKRQELLTFVLVGAGPTGVEMAGANGIVSIGKWRFSGIVGWFLWLVVHLMFLIGFRNRMVVLFQWVLFYTTFQRGARLITFQDMATPI